MWGRSFAAPLLAVVVACSEGCAAHPSFAQALADHLEGMRAALGDVGAPSYLRYDARVGGEAWSYEIVRAPGVFAERRSRGSNVYTVGLDRGVPWMRTRARRAVVIDGELEWEARTEAAIWGLGFAHPRAGDTTELVTGGRSTFEMAHQPKDGETIWLTVGRADELPTSYDVVDPYDHPTRCDDLVWRRGSGPAAIERAHCSGIVSEVGTHDVDLTLAESRALADVPAWARAGDALPIAPQKETVTIPIADPMRIIVPTSISGSDPVPMVLDSGAPFTAITRTQARALGVVDAVEVPAHVKPPWLPTDTYAVGIIDRLVVGSVELHGVRVFIMEDDDALGDEAGLLGVDFFRRFVVDVDSPRGELRLVARDGFTPDPRSVAIPMLGLSHRSVSVLGGVDRVDEGTLVVDTGAPLDIVVSDVRMASVHLRRRGADAFLAAHEEETSADYVSEIDGMHLGPFHFPQMPAFGRDRERERLGCALGLVGMGILRHMRLVFDAHGGEVYATPGPSYAALADVGVEIEDRGGKPVVTRVVPRSPADGQRLRMGDEVIFVGRKRTRSARAALAEIAATVARQDTVDISVNRNTHRFTRRVAVALGR